MKRKKIIYPQRLRRIPKQFSWVDHRLVSKGYLQRSSREALALYLFLITVADADGISYYADSTISKLLSCDLSELRISREELKNLGLIAYERPFYQVLDLEGHHITDENVVLMIKKAVSDRQENDQPMHENTSKVQLQQEGTGKTQSIGDILKKIGGGR